MNRLVTKLFKLDSFITYCTENDTGYVSPVLITLAVEYWSTNTGLKIFWEPLLWMSTLSYALDMNLYYVGATYGFAAVGFKLFF